MDWEKYFQWRYEMYKDFIIKNGGDKEIFDIPYIQEIIMDLIENGDPRLISEGKSTLFFKNPNEDGSFDICGRTCGYNVTVCYKMKKYPHFILINKYSLKTEFMPDRKMFMCPTPYITRQDIVIYPEDNVVDIMDTVWESRAGDNALLVNLQKDGKIKSII